MKVILVVVAFVFSLQSFAFGSVDGNRENFSTEINKINFDCTLKVFLDDDEKEAVASQRMKGRVSLENKTLHFPFILFERDYFISVSHDINADRGERFEVSFHSNYGDYPMPLSRSSIETINDSKIPSNFRISSNYRPITTVPSETQYLEFKTDCKITRAIE